MTVSRRWGGRTWRIAAMIVCIPGIFWGLGNRDWPIPLRSRRPEGLSTVTVNRGDVVQVVTEGGSLETANTPSVRCRVESFVGLIETRSGAPSLSPVKIPAALGGPKDPAATNARGVVDAAKAATLGPEWPRPSARTRPRAILQRAGPPAWPKGRIPRLSPGGRGSGASITEYSLTSRCGRINSTRFP